MSLRQIAALFGADEEECVYEKRYVPGLAEVALGYRPAVLTTVYNVSGDDTSGIAGMLWPSGEFTPLPKPRIGEVISYIDDDEPLNRHKKAQICWDGNVGYEIEIATPVKVRIEIPPSKDTESTRRYVARAKHETCIVNRRRVDRNELLGDIATSGELYRAMTRGTGQR